MKNPIQKQQKKTENQQEKYTQTQQITQQKKANLTNPFLPNNNSNGKPNPFTNNKNVTTAQMKTVQGTVTQRVANGVQNPTNRNPQRRTVPAPTVAYNQNYNALKDSNNNSSAEGEQEGWGDKMDKAEEVMGDVGDAAGVIGDHNDTQSLIARTELAKSKGVGLDDLTEEESEGAETGKEVASNDTLSGITGTVGGLLTMGSAFKAWGDSEDNWDKAGAVLQGAGGAADVVSNVAGLLGGDKIAAIADSVSAGISAVKSTLEVIKGLKELKNFDGDKKEKGLEIAKSASQGVKKGFEATKKMMQAFGSIAPSAVTQAIPILSIIFSAIEIIQEAFELIEAVKNYKAMSQEKDAMRNDQDSQHFTKKEKRGFIGFRKEKQVTDKEKLKNVMSGAGLDGLSQEEKERVSEKAKNFDMVKTLKKINKERIIRSATNIGLSVVGIIGDIVTLTGVGAPVGVIIKSAAGAAKSGLKLFRGAKQLYNNVKGNENSDKNQHIKRMSQVKYMFSLVKSMTSFKPDTDQGRNGANAMANKIDKYLTAMGTNTENFVKFKSEPDRAIKLVYSALKKREGSDKVSG